MANGKKETPYTTIERRKIIEMWKDGMRVKAICEKTGRSEYSVRSMLKRQRKQEGVKVVPYCTSGWTDADVEKLCELWERGLTIAIIARRLGKPKDKVRDKIRSIRRRYGYDRLPFRFHMENKGK